MYKSAFDIPILRSSPMSQQSASWYADSRIGSIQYPELHVFKARPSERHNSSDTDRSWYKLQVSHKMTSHGGIRFSVPLSYHEDGPPD